MGSVQIERRTVEDTIRQIVTDKAFAIDHQINATAKAAVDPSDTGLTSTAGYWKLIDRFQARSVLERIGGVEVPFSTPASVLTDPPAAYWVGRGKPSPVSKAGIARVNLDPLKLVSLLVQSAEVIRGSGERADRELTRAIANAAASAVNTTLLSTAAGAEDESPAGLGYDLTPIASSGLSDGELFDDLIGLVAGMDRPTIVASLPFALRIQAALRGADALSVVVAPEAGDLAFAIEENALAYAIGGIDVSTSENATLQMADNPSEGPTTAVSMYQTDSVALKVVVTVNWEVVGPVAALDFGGPS
jgi:hypothetical protein